MKLNFSFILSFFLLSVVYSQQSSVVKSYTTTFKKIDSLNLRGIDKEQTDRLLKSIEQSKDFKENDTLKAMVYLTRGVYYMNQDKDLKKSEFYSTEAEKLYIKIGMLNKASTALHNKSVLYQIFNKIDTAIVIGNKAIEMAQKAQYTEQFHKSLIANGRRLQYLGKYKESNELLFSIVNEVKDLETRSALHGNIATNYTEIGIREKAEFHYLKSLHYMKSSKSPLLWKIYANIASFYNSIDQFETGLKYSDSVWISSKTDDAMSFYHVNRAASFKGLERWEDALNSINMTLQLDQKMGEDYYLANDYADRGNIYFELKEFQKAFKDYEVAQKMFEGLNDYSRKSELLKRVVETYLIINNPTIHDHFRNFLQMNDSINQQKLDENFTALDTKFQTAEKEAKIKEQALKLEKEKVRKNQLYYGLGILMLLGLGGFLWYRSRQKRKQLESEHLLLDMKHNLAQLELQNLNQQLNPHEFKNMMMVLAPEIQVKAPQAYQHLLRISQLIKAALHQSSITDSLENQLNQIESYLAIEKELLVYPLEWDIKATVPDMNIEIPRLLLKNMVENAVKHGVKNLKSPGKILVEVHQNGHDLHLTIDDNGVGRMQSVAMDSGIGTSTYFKLFETLNAKNKNKARMNILDKEVGTRVEIKIPLDYQY